LCCRIPRHLAAASGACGVLGSAPIAQHHGRVIAGEVAQQLLGVRLLEWRLSTDLQIYSRLLAAAALNLVLNGLSFVRHVRRH
jgi:hypothetical protein